MSDEAVKITRETARSLFGLDATKNGDPDKAIDSTRSMQRFTPGEVAAYSRALWVPPSSQHPNIQGAGILSYLKPIHQQVGNKRVQLEKMRSLAPEIEQSRVLVSSSIMSPNDLQDGEFIFSFEDISSLKNDAELAEGLVEVFNQFFNKELQLGIKSYDWIGEIQYGSGSKPVLILPVATMLDLRNRSAADVRKDMKDSLTYPFTDSSVAAGVESFSEYCKHLPQDDDYLYSGLRGKRITWKSVLEGSTAEQDVLDMVPSMEDFGVRVPTPYKSKDAPHLFDDVDYDTGYIRGLESMVVNLKTRLEEGDGIKVSENAEVLRFSPQYRLKSKKELMEKLEEKYKQRKKKVDYILREEMVDLKAKSDKYANQGHPTVIELPPESVVPIFIPGTPEQHLGYFVLIDQNGQPLTIENSGMLNTDSNCQKGGMNNASYEAIFGQGNLGQRFFGDGNTLNAAGSMIFNHMLDKYLRSRIQGVFGRNDLSIARFNAVATTLFFRLLERKETTLVFVPTDLLHYFAFAYDKYNGTGISKLDDIEFLLSMRTTYLIANIIAMANDAVQQKIVNVGVDDKTANLEALLDMVAQIFIAKQKVNGSLDPSEIIRDIYSNSLCIVPKGVPGLSDFSVEVSNNSSQSTRADDALMEQLTNLLVSHLDVPPSALNQLSEPEYAKSLVTYNLFFAKKVSRYQRIWCNQISAFVKDYATFSVPFRKALAKKLDGNIKRRAGNPKNLRVNKPTKNADKVPATNSEGMPQKVVNMLDKSPNKYSSLDIDKLVDEIIDGVEVRLPTPNIVVDTAQFEQIRNYTSNLGELAELFFPQELVPSEDENATAAQAILKAQWKKEQTNRFISQVGNFTMVEPPEEDAPVLKITNYLQMLQNANKGITMQREAIAAAGKDDSFGGGGGDDFGGDMDFGGDDFGGDEGGGMDPNNPDIDLF